MICSTSQANVRYGLCVYADVCQLGDQRWRDILIQQQAHRYPAAASSEGLAAVADVRAFRRSERTVERIRDLVG